MLRTRQLIPPLTMRAPDGRSVRAWDYKQKKNLVIAFLDAGCAPCGEFLRRVAAGAAELRARDALALFVFLEPPPAATADALPPEVVVGADISGRAQKAYLGGDDLPDGANRRGVFVADRYGELCAAWTPRDHEFPGVAEILRWLDHLAIACEECSPPHWPAEP